MFCGMVFLWHIPAVYRWAMHGELRHWLMTLGFLGAGLLFWSVVMRPVERRRLDYASCALYVLSAALLTGLPGALITFARRPLYLAEFHGPMPFGLTALADQQLAGLIMWIPMDLILFVVALALMAAALSRNGRVDRSPEGITVEGDVHPPPDVENAHRAYGPQLPGANSAELRRLDATAGCAPKLANLNKAEQVGYDGLPAPIFIRTVGMQSIATASPVRIDQRRREIVAAQKPGQCPRGFGFPLDIQPTVTNLANRFLT